MLCEMLVCGFQNKEIVSASLAKETQVSHTNCPLIKDQVGEFGGGPTLNPGLYHKFSSK